MCRGKGRERSLQPEDFEGNCHFLLLSDNFVNSRCDRNNRESELGERGEVAGAGFGTEGAPHARLRGFAQEFRNSGSCRARVASRGCGENFQSREGSSSGVGTD